MSTTTYLNLNKPTGSDLVNPLVDTFPNWDIVDSAYHDLDLQSIGTATELVSQGVHALTRLDQNTKTFKFIATGNYTAGETFTVDGIQCNAYTPGGTPLASNCYVTGSVVLVSLNADDSALTFYVTGSATSQDSEKLGGELPSYYAKQSDMSDAETDITNLKNLAGNTSIAGIGDGTLTGAVSSLNTNLTWTWLGDSVNGATINNFDLSNYSELQLNIFVQVDANTQLMFAERLMTDSFLLGAKILRGGGSFANELDGYQFIISKTEFRVSGVYVGNTDFSHSACLVQLYAR